MRVAATFIAFPTLTGVIGLTEKLANATCTVGLWPGYAASVAAALRKMRDDPRELINMGQRAREAAKNYARVNELKRFVATVEDATDRGVS